ncbi:hypothetical protein ACG83_09120 [Frankia sp. R43]|uniref:hypothetical protein n=1 Tax=Frankia sp. R43 TaxID=269536 RepID=UPI0006D99011|nr:hypothetical protein [Frankia sp. R43]KPM55479.1 hypothetical protein ACG83_09120 [Frankia sp. R43]
MLPVGSPAGDEHPGRPTVINVAGIARMLGITQQRADQLSRIKGFPDPLPAVGRVRVWLVSEVEVWADEHRPGWREKS